MFVYLVRRVLTTIPTLLGVAAIVFTLFNVVVSDPALLMAGKHANEQQLAEIRKEYGYDQPLYIQFGRYLKGIATLDFGRSHATKQEIGKMIENGIVPSLSLAVPAFLITSVLSILLALLSSFFQGRPIDRTIVFFSVVGMSFPAMAYILYGQQYLAYQLQLFPISGYESVFEHGFTYLALPILIFVTLSIGYDVRFYRTALLEEVRQDYVRTARAKGLSEIRIFGKHVLKNGMVPIITNLVYEIPLLILGSFLLETFFSIPGLGGMTIQAIHNGDLPVVMAMTTLQSMLAILANLLTDVMYTLVDPRVSFS